MNNYASMYENGESIKYHYFEAIKYYHILIETGNSDAMYDYAMMHHNKEGIGTIFAFFYNQCFQYNIVFLLFQAN